MKIASPETMRQMDRVAIERYRIPGLILMENAARQTALTAMSMVSPQAGVVLVLAGPGNNGGDAFGATRHLLNAGYAVRVFTTKEVDHYTGDAAVQLQILIEMGVPVGMLQDTLSPDAWEKIAAGCSLLLDGLYGTGLRGETDGMAKALILQTHRFPGKILSIDIPSGIDGLTGQVLGAAIKADATVTFALGKPGLYLYPGAAYAGKVHVVDISLPLALMEPSKPLPEIIDAALVASLLPDRAADAHKGSVGTVLMAAGSEGMTGAAVLAAASALRGGAGLVRCAIPYGLLPILSTLVPEVVGIPLKEDALLWTCSAGDDLWPYIQSADALLIGPGLPVQGETAELLDRIIDEASVPLVLDAGALGILASGAPNSLKPGQTVLTPHPGEMARLMHCTVAEVLQDPMKAAQKMAQKLGAVVVLKGAGTVVADSSGHVFINTTGNSGMATAGAGDVLAGLIVSLLAQGLEPLQAAVCGVWLHGLAGDLAAEAVGRQADRKSVV